jgi:RimJ/RimL family protein N-acetyltransferase
VRDHEQSFFVHDIIQSLIKVRLEEREMNIRKAEYKDLDTIMKIYGHARQFMAENGNPTQWGTGNPKREVIEQDIARGVGYVCEDGDEICGVFAFILGEDPTYAVIEDGKWINDEPYGTVHRIAGAGTVKGVSAACFDWCFKQCPSLRVDTHENNKIMQHVIEKNGFVKCGRIYVADGSPRIAYQKVE